jgi:hypothetical protein
MNLGQKDILMADMSEHGWVMMAKYEEDELADNSDDERCLYRTEMRVGRKVEQKCFG